MKISRPTAQSSRSPQGEADAEQAEEAAHQRADQQRDEAGQQLGAPAGEITPGA